MRERIEDAWGVFVEASEQRGLDYRFVLGSISAIFVVTIVIVASLMSISTNFIIGDDERQQNVLDIEWNEAVYMPRAEECIDESNGQDLPEFGIGYEPSLAMDSEGNMFITAHKDLRWGGEATPFGPILGGDLGLWYACEDGRDTSWDYWASWFWISNDGGLTWGPGDNFDPTPGNHLTANYLAGGSECLGDEGDILSRHYFGR